MTPLAARLGFSPDLIHLVRVEAARRDGLGAVTGFDWDDDAFWAPYAADAADLNALAAEVAEDEEPAALRAVRKFFWDDARPVAPAEAKRVARVLRAARAPLTSAVAVHAAAALTHALHREPNGTWWLTRWHTRASGPVFRDAFPLEHDRRHARLFLAPADQAALGFQTVVVLEVLARQALGERPVRR